jgi:limonene-1,2-epoxide hydrolase
MVTANSEQEQLVIENAKAWNEMDRSRLPEILSESVVMEEPGLHGIEEIPGPDGEAHGIEGVKAWMGVIENEWTEFEVSLQRLVSDGNVVMSEAEFSGVFVQTGNEVAFSGMEVYEIEASKIQQWRLYFDMIEVGQLMGVIE